MESTKMSADGRCPQCGDLLPEAPLLGLCPRCLARQAAGVLAARPGATPTPAVVTEHATRNTSLRYFGDYELLEEIARGGMGVVWKARQVSLNRVVAVKMLLAGRFSSAEYARRFRTEAEAAANLKHPNIVAIHEVGEHDGQQYFSMNYIEGLDLTRLVRENPLPPRRAAAYLETIAGAIHYAHGRGVIHRDLKPSNVLLDAEDQPQVTDFGLAKILVRTGSTPSPPFSNEVKDAVERVPTDGLTATGQVLGTPGFMPPEQASGRRGAITAASDVYSLGAILYFLVTGRAPFAADSLEATLCQVLNVEPVSPRLLNPAVPRDLETICLKCLEKLPRERYGSAQELADELHLFLAGKTIHARPVSAPEKLWRWCQRHPLVASLVLALNVVLALGLAGILWQWGRAKQSANKARFAQRETTTNLWHSYLAQARANRFSGRPGRRFDSLDALAKAAAIRPAPELRDEAIAALAYIDLREVKRACSDLPLYASSVADAALERYAVTLPDGVISVRRRQDDAELLRLPVAENTLNRVLGFSHDGRLLAAHYTNNALRVWNLEQRRVVASGHCADLLSMSGSSIDFRPDDGELATADATPVLVLLNLVDGTRRQLKVPDGAQVVRYSPTGEFLAVGFQNSSNVVVLDVATGGILRTLRSGEPIRALAWHPDGTRLAGNDTARKLTVWDWRRGEPIGSLAGHNEDITSLAFHPNGRLLLSSGWEGIFVWDHHSGESLLTLAGAAGAMRLSADGTRLFKRQPTKAELTWCEMTDDRPVRRFGSGSLAEPARTINATAFSPDGTWLVSARERILSIYEVATGNPLAEANVEDVDALAVDARANVWTSSAQGLARRPIHRHRDSNHWVLGPSERIGDTHLRRKVAVSADGSAVAAIDGRNSVHVLDAVSGQELALIRFKPDGVRYLAFSANGEWLATGNWHDPGADIWEARTGKLLRRVGKEPVDEAGGVGAFSTDGRWFFKVSRGGIAAWRTDSWELAWNTSKEDTLMVLGLAPDTSLLAVRHDKSVLHLLAPESGKRLATFESPNGDHITSLIFSPDGTRLAMQGTRSRELFVWDLRRVRAELSALGQDWDRPAYPPEREVPALSGQLEILTNR